MNYYKLQVLVVTNLNKNRFYLKRITVIQKLFLKDSLNHYNFCNDYTENLKTLVKTVRNFTHNTYLNDSGGLACLFLQSILICLLVLGNHKY